MRLREQLRKWIGAANASAVLDYGCGTQRTVAEECRKLRIPYYRHDPGIPELALVPDKFLEHSIDKRLIYCCMVLQHVPLKDLETILGFMRELAPNVCILVPHTQSTTHGPEGRLNTIVKPRKWWLETLKAHWPEIRASESGRRRRGKPETLFTTYAVRTKRRTRSVKNLKGKSVAIVGRAASLSGEGSLIDSHDVVVRVNAVMPLQHPEKDVGRRTDIVFTCRGCSGIRNKARKAGVTIMRSTPEVERRVAKLDGSKGYKAFSGTAAVFWALDQGAASVYVTGMDLYTGPPNSSRGGQISLKGSRFHDPNIDKKLLRRLLGDKRFRPSQKLREVLSTSEPLQHFKEATV